jgi:hypothetical protein
MFVGLICLFLIKKTFLPFFFSATEAASFPREKISSDSNNFMASSFDSLSPANTLFFILSSINNYKSKGVWKIKEERPPLLFSSLVRRGSGEMSKRGIKIFSFYYYFLI